MQFRWILLVALLSVLGCHDTPKREPTTPIEAIEHNVRIEPFLSSDFPGMGQCGCWYRSTDQEAEEPLLAKGDAAKEVLYMIINGENETIGNWQLDNSQDIEIISYYNDRYHIDIESSLMSETPYAAEFTSTITILSNEQQTKIQARALCGC